MRPVRSLLYLVKLTLRLRICFSCFKLILHIVKYAKKLERENALKTGHCRSADVSGYE